MTQHAPLLSIDCSTGPCSVAITRDGDVLAQRHEPTSSAQAKLLVPMMQAAMKDAGLAYQQLGLILCTTGPGSFTGIRIGLASARATGFSAGVAVHGISTLALLAQAAQEENAESLPIAVLMQAGKNQLYAQIFGGEKACGPCLVGIPTLADWLPPQAILCGNAAELAGGGYKIATHALQPDAVHAAALVMRDPEAAGEPSPLYIRPPDAIVPQKPITAA